MTLWKIALRGVHGKIKFGYGYLRKTDIGTVTCTVYNKKWKAAIGYFLFMVKNKIETIHNVIKEYFKKKRK